MFCIFVLPLTIHLKNKWSVNSSSTSHHALAFLHPCFNGISTFEDYLMLKPSVSRNSGASIKHNWGIEGFILFPRTHTHTHTHTYIYIYIYIYSCECVCVCVCVRERERGGWFSIFNTILLLTQYVCIYLLTQYFFFDFLFNDLSTFLDYFMTKPSL